MNDEILDLFCIGMGPAGLAVAIGMHDNPQAQHLKAHFIEMQPRFAWHPGMVIPGYKMQVSFLKDLVTMRDPTSKFSFLNFMKLHGRLIDFFGLYTFLPLRSEMNEYMAWCASFFKDITTYSAQGVSIEPYFLPGSDGKTVEILKCTYRNTETGELSYRLTRNAIIATGAQPRIPEEFPQHHPRVIHSSRYLFTEIPDDVKRIGVIGAGQSAGEIFKHTTTRFPEAETRLIIRKTAIRPADTSNFINERYNPEAVSYYFELPEVEKLKLLDEMHNTAVGIVHETLLADLWRMKYDEKAVGSYGRHRILNNTTVTKVEAFDDSVHVTMTSDITGEESTEVYDFFFIGMGYIRRTQVDLLQEHCADALFPLSLRRDYSAWSKDPDFKAGVYLQGQAEGSHGIGDGALSNLSVRGYEVIESIVKRKAGVDWAPDEKVNKVQISSRNDGLIWGF